MRGRFVLLFCVVSLLAGVFNLLAACSEPAPPPVYQAIPVERRDIVVSAEAAGVVEPEVTVEVKSKASGEILEMHVETGDSVTRESLLVRIDQRQPRNALAQAEAELEVAHAGLANAESQKRRAQELFKAQSMSETEYDAALLNHATARAEVVRARVAVENAKIALADTEVRAPITGTIIEKHVERGQVISSPTRDVGGGTVLLKMADLNRVRVRTLVDETDIGKIHPGLTATVTAAAYPQRPFAGEVLKIEPQAVTEQNVTMFPVLVAVENPGGDLKPGMNCEVEMHIGSREQVLAVPNAALRTERDVGSAAQVLGISDEVVRSAFARAQRNGDGDAKREEGSQFVVFVQNSGPPSPVLIRTGLTDLDYSEVLDGLSTSDAVLILPSAGLVQSQERFRERMVRVRGDGLPGMKNSKAGR